MGNGTVGISGNSGATWTTTNSLPVYAINIGHTVASSADGTVLAICSYFGNIYVSTDSGATWTAHDSGRNWTGIACSTNGTKMVACALGGRLYTSTDTGTTWNPRDSVREWNCVASSADGTDLMAAEGGDTNGYVYTSTDSGVTWGQTLSTYDNYDSVACSADGSVVIASTHHDNFAQPDLTPGNIGYIYWSPNGGTNWTYPGGTTSPGVQYTCVTLSADGTRTAGCGESQYPGDTPGVIYTSSDQRQSWQLGYAPHGAWSSITSSADGSKLAACSRINGAIYTYAEPATNAPQLNISLAGGSAYLSWPWPSTGYILQQNTDLVTTNWVAVSSPPAVVNQVIAPATNSQNLYRLVQP